PSGSSSVTSLPSAPVDLQRPDLDQRGQHALRAPAPPAQALEGPASGGTARSPRVASPSPGGAQRLAMHWLGPFIVAFVSAPCLANGGGLAQGPATSPGAPRPAGSGAGPAPGDLGSAALAQPNGSSVPATPSGVGAAGAGPELPAGSGMMSRVEEETREHLGTSAAAAAFSRQVSHVSSARGRAGDHHKPDSIMDDDEDLSDDQERSHRVDHRKRSVAGHASGGTARAQAHSDSAVLAVVLRTVCLLAALMACFGLAVAATARGCSWAASAALRDPAGAALLAAGAARGCEPAEQVGGCRAVQARCRPWRGSAWAPQRGRRPGDSAWPGQGSVCTGLGPGMRGLRPRRGLGSRSARGG
ncbi:unnamed protein product, partial [Prorocentrum cordatum]